LFFDPAAAASRLARPIAGPPENAGEDVRLPIDVPRLAKPAGGDQPDVLGNRGVRRARPLAIDNLMEIVGISDVGRLQYASPAGRPVVRREIARDTPRRAAPNLPSGLSGPKTPDAAAPYTRTCRSRHPSRWPNRRRAGLLLRQLASSRQGLQRRARRTA